MSSNLTAGYCSILVLVGIFFYFLFFLFQFYICFTFSFYLYSYYLKSQMTFLNLLLSILKSFFYLSSLLFFVSLIFQFFLYFQFQLKRDSFQAYSCLRFSCRPQQLFLRAQYQIFSFFFCQLLNCCAFLKIIFLYQFVCVWIWAYFTIIVALSCSISFLKSFICRFCKICLDFNRFLSFYKRRIVDLSFQFSSFINFRNLFQQLTSSPSEVEAVMMALRRTVSFMRYYFSILDYQKTLICGSCLSSLIFSSEFRQSSFNYCIFFLRIQVQTGCFFACYSQFIAHYHFYCIPQRNFTFLSQSLSLNLRFVIFCFSALSYSLRDWFS